MSKTIGKVTTGDMTCELDSELKCRVVGDLNALLADEYALFTKTLSYHWNITGPRFHSLHEFFEGHYRSLLEMMDEVAERVRFLGESPLGTVESLGKKMNITETNAKNLSDIDMLEDLLGAHNNIQSEIKKTLKAPKLLDDDPGTDDLLGSLLRQHEQMSWMIRSHLQ